MSTHEKIFLVTDGASRGNPGPSAIGFGVYDKNWKPLEESAEYIGLATNNEAEYRALIRGLEICMKYSKSLVEHLTDSRLVARQSSGHWRVRSPNLKPLAEKVSMKKLRFQQVTHIYVPRDDPRIQRIDEMINENLDNLLM